MSDEKNVTRKVTAHIRIAPYTQTSPTWVSIGPGAESDINDWIALFLKTIGCKPKTTQYRGIITGR